MSVLCIHFGTKWNTFMFLFIKKYISTKVKQTILHPKSLSYSKAKS